MDKIRHQYLRLSQELSNYVIIVVNYNVNGREDGRKTKDREGVCRRCGSEIPLAERRFVLCPSCRENLRLRKASRQPKGDVFIVRGHWMHLFYPKKTKVTIMVMSRIISQTKIKITS